MDILSRGSFCISVFLKLPKQKQNVPVFFFFLFVFVFILFVLHVVFLHLCFAMTKETWQVNFWTDAKGELFLLPLMIQPET